MHLAIVQVFKVNKVSILGSVTRAQIVARVSIISSPTIEAGYAPGDILGSSECENGTMDRTTLPVPLELDRENVGTTGTTVKLDHSYFFFRETGIAAFLAGCCGIVLTNWISPF
jgi:hypothetical protein